MKRYSSTKKENSRRTLLAKYALRGAVLAISIVFLIYVLPAIFFGAVRLFWYPFDAARLWINESSSSLPVYIRDRRALMEELESVKMQVATEEGNEATIKKLQAENDDLRNLLGAVPNDRKVARVIGRPNAMPYDVLMIDQGSVDGITQFAPVFLGRDQVIGVVMRVNERTSLVALTTTAGFTATAYVYGPNIFTYAEGMGGGILRVRIPQSIQLSIGDVVVLPGIDSGIFGSISDINTSPTQPEQYGYIRLPQSLQSIAYVSVGHDPIVTNTFAEAKVLVEDLRNNFLQVNVPPEFLVTPEAIGSSTATSAATSTATTSGSIQ